MEKILVKIKCGCGKTFEWMQGKAGKRPLYCEDCNTLRKRKQLQESRKERQAAKRLDEMSKKLMARYASRRTNIKKRAITVSPKSKKV
jgi:hypothetical protein